MFRTSTIAAIATATGGGIGILRISGPDAEAIGCKLLKPWPASPLSHTMYLGRVHDSLDQAIDQVMFCLMRAPRSYTGEDVLEIHGHGSAISLRRILAAVIACGARVAEPGEFTRRAFLAGKLDLSQAEALCALIAAQSEQAQRHAHRQLAGELFREAEELRRQCTSLLGEFEGALDFPDVEEDAQVVQAARPRMSELLLRMGRLAQSFRRGKVLNEGIEIALCGCTNAGKSSLLNALSGSERVLVDSEPGTTRDYIEVQTAFGGHPVTLIDTAGERADCSEMERQGLRLGRERCRRADLYLLVVDGVLGITKEVEALRQRLSADVSNVPTLIVWNKIDQAGCQPPPEGALGCSALCNQGIRALQEHILTRLTPPDDAGDEPLLMSARQAKLFEDAEAALLRAQAGLFA